MVSASGYGLGQVVSLLKETLGSETDQALSPRQIQRLLESGAVTYGGGGAKWRRCDLRDVLVLSCTQLIEGGRQRASPDVVREIARAFNGVKEDDLESHLLVCDLERQIWRLVPSQGFQVPDAAIFVDVGRLLSRLRSTLTVLQMPEIWSTPGRRTMVIQTGR